MIFQENQSFHKGKYKILSWIARGGFGEVWKARRASDGKIVAIKILTRQALLDETAAQRFELEYNILKELDHPHIIRVHDYGHHQYHDSRLPWFSMDYYHTNFHKRVQQVDSVGEKLQLLLPILDALDYAHRKNICHRDLKPMNVLVDEDDRSVLTDFGIAKQTDVKSMLTGRIPIGTPIYMSPEQCRGEGVGPASDIYTLGVILYNVCSGKYPFESTSHIALLQAHVQQAPVHVRDVAAGISNELGEAIMRCLEKEPHDRYASSSELRWALLRCPELQESSAEKRVFKRGDLVRSKNVSYRVYGLIAQGGFAEVYRVRRLNDGRLMALKILRPLLSEDDEARKRFRREIQILEKVRHPNIAGVEDEGTHPHRYTMLPYFVMNYYPGNLLDALKEPVDLNKAFPVVLDVLDGLAYAHGQGGGILHRDLKPANILIDPEGRGHLADFGIAKVTNADWASKTSANITKVGMGLGTSPYMSPEQFHGGAGGNPVDARSDVYSLGVILYELVSGRRPFEAASEIAMAAAHERDIPLPPSERNPAVPPAVEAIVLKCLEKAPAKRFQSAAELAEAIRAAKGKHGWFTGKTVVVSDFRSVVRFARRTARTSSPYLAAGVALLVFGASTTIGDAIRSKRARERSVAASKKWDADRRAKVLATLDALVPPDRATVAAIVPAERAEAFRLASADLDKARAAGDWAAAFGAQAELNRIAAEAKANLPAIRTAEVLSTSPRYLEGREATPLGFQLSDRRPEVEAAFKRKIDVFRIDEVGQPGEGTPVPEAKVEVAPEGEGYRVRLAGLTEGAYRVKVSGSFGEGAAAIALPSVLSRDFTIQPPGDWEIVRDGSKRAWTLLDSEGRAQSVKWSLQAPGGEEIPLKAGSNDKTVELADSVVAGLKEEGAYTVVCRIHDSETGEETPPIPSGDPFVLDKTPPKLLVELAGVPGDAEGFAGAILFPGESVEARLRAEDAQAKYFLYRMRGTRLSAAPGVEGTARISWSEPKGAAGEETIPFTAIEAADDSANESEPIAVPVLSIAASARETIAEWRALEAAIAANPSAYARTNALAPVERGETLLAALADDAALKGWLRAEIDSEDPADSLTKILGEFERARDRRAEFKERDDRFLAIASALDGALAKFPDAFYGERPKAEIAKALADRRAEWAKTADADAEPKEFLGEIARLVLPQPPAEPPTPLFDIPGRETVDAKIRILPDPSAKAAGVAWRYAILDADATPEEAAAELARVDTLVPPDGDAEFSPSPPYEELARPRALAYQWVLRDGEGMLAESEPRLYAVPAPVSFDAAELAELEDCISFLNQLRQAFKAGSDIGQIPGSAFPADFDVLPRRADGTIDLKKLNDRDDANVKEAVWYSWISWSGDAAKKGAVKTAIAEARRAIGARLAEIAFNAEVKATLDGAKVAWADAARNELEAALREARAGTGFSSDKSDEIRAFVEGELAKRLAEKSEGRLAPPDFGSPERREVEPGASVSLSTREAAALKASGLRASWVAAGAEPTDWRKPNSSGDRVELTAPKENGEYDLAFRVEREAFGATLTSPPGIFGKFVVRPKPTPTPRPEKTPPPATPTEVPKTPPPQTPPPATPPPATPPPATPPPATPAKTQAPPATGAITMQEAGRALSAALPRKGGGYGSDYGRVLAPLLALYAPGGSPGTPSYAQAAAVSKLVKYFEEPRRAANVARDYDSGAKWIRVTNGQDLGGGRFRFDIAVPGATASYEFEFARIDGKIRVLSDR